MADPLGLLSGTDCELATTGVGGVIGIIGGATNNGSAITNALLETTNKSSGEFRTIKAGSGTQSIDHTLEVFWSQDEYFEMVVENNNARSVNDYFLIYGPIVDGVKIDQFKFIISDFSDSSELNTPVSSSVTFQNSGSFMVNEQYFFAVDSNTEDATDSNGEFAIARA